MTLFSHVFPLTTTGLALLGGLLSSCSSPDPATNAALPSTGPPPAPTTEAHFGSRVDSLNGIMGHAFGEPLRAFPKMRQLPPSPGEVTRTYAYEGTEGWFGKHRAQVPTQLYSFLDGKFCHFLAIGHPTILRPEATYLFGPGQAQGSYRLFWEGSRARAVYVEQARGMGMEGRLDVLSKVLEAEQAARQQARLTAENK